MIINLYCPKCGSHYSHKTSLGWSVYECGSYIHSLLEGLRESPGCAQIAEIVNRTTKKLIDERNVLTANYTDVFESNNRTIDRLKHLLGDEQSNAKAMERERDEWKEKATKFAHALASELDIDIAILNV